MRRSEPDDMSSVSTSSYSDGRQNNNKRRSHSSATVVTPQNKRRRRIEKEGRVAVYNLRPGVSIQSFLHHIKRRISEMRDVEVVRSRVLPPVDGRVTAIINFRDSEEACLALCLNGIKYKGRAIYAKVYDSDKKTKERRTINEKQQLCIDFLVGACTRGSSCIHAHGVLDLKFYNDTVLDESRCIYINELPKNIRTETLHKIVLDQFKHEPFLTAFHHRKKSRDAMIEFANPTVAARAYAVLDGYQCGSSSLAVHPWKPEYHSVFAAYFSNDDREEEEMGSDEKSRGRDTSPRFNRGNDDENSAKSPRRAQKTTHSEHSGKAAEDNAPMKRVVAQNDNNKVAQRGIESKLIEEKQKQEQAVRDLKATTISLREELLQAKTEAVTAKEKVNDLTWKNKELTQDHTYNLQKIETLEKDNTELNKLLDEVKKDVKFYREKLESDRSYTREYRKMEEKVDRLQRENDSLRRQSLSPGDRREQEQARRRIRELEHRLGGAVNRNDVYLKDMEGLREKVQRLEAMNRRLQQQPNMPVSSQNCSRGEGPLQLKLEEAMSRNENLEKALTGANDKVDRLNNENHRLQREKAAMQEELQKMTKVKLEPTH